MSSSPADGRRHEHFEVSGLMYADTATAPRPLEHSGTRLSDSDRVQGRRLLNEHVAVGCLTSEEFGDRAVQVEHARTRSELLSVFQDLPQPHPRFGGQPAPRRSAAAAPKPSPEVPHLRYAVTAIISSCAIAGALGAFVFALQEPAVLFIAAGVVLTVYFALIILGHRSEC